MKYGLICILLAIGLASCEKLCNEDSRLGEILEIPLDLQNYAEGEAAFLRVVNINGEQRDTSFLRDLLFFGRDNVITDQQPDGYYSSNLDGSSLYFYELIENDSIVLRDSMTNIVIKKSQEKVDDPCYEDDPNIQIDQVSFIHAGVTKGKGDVVVLGR
jgi:hypothetical protein